MGQCLESEQQFMSLSRPVKFFILEKLLLPLAVFPIRLLVKSWRRCEADRAVLREVARRPRVVLITYHGMLLHLLAFARLAPRPLVVMTSPSFDGRLLAAFLKGFGVDHVFGSSASRSIGGSLEFVRRIRSGEIGLIAVDGPRGPRCVAKPGFLKIAAAADAHLLLATSSAGRGISFGTWDGAHLPAPFARVRLTLQLLPPPAGINPQAEIDRVQNALIDAARGIASPVLGDPMLRPRGL
jgi:lysophospholipid acyltransferase (LPLAT)-like uncharacterized protein